MSKHDTDAQTPNATSSNLKGFHILVVDDLPENLELLVNTLAFEEANIQACQSGEEALKLVSKHVPDIVLLDVRMPGIDGFETCRRMKSMANMADVPIIFLTAETDTAQIEEGFRAGGVDYVTKPFNLKKILVLLRAHLEHVNEPSEPDQDQFLDTAEVLEALSSNQIFEGLSKDKLRPLVHEMKWLSVPAGRRLIRQGQQGKAIYFVISGRLGVWIEREEGKEDLLAEIGRGECVGEISVLTNDVATAHVDAIRDSNVIQLSNDVFNQIIATEWTVLQNVNRLLIHRIKNQNRQLPASRQSISIALIPTHPSVPLTHFANQLTESIAHYTTATCLNAQTIDQQLGAGSAQAEQDGEIQRKVVNWLNTQEHHYNIVFYEADPTPSVWTSRCMRQADRILIVGLSGENPTPCEIEQELSRITNLARRDLILLHPETTSQPVDTTKWLAPRDVSNHYHVRIGDTPMLKRLSRILMGRTVSLVLSGGSSRGMAHIGILRALAKHSIPIDFVGGTSVGSVIAAQFALGQSLEEIPQYHKKWWIKESGMHKYTLPWISLAADRIYNTGMRNILGSTQIEDLWINWFAVSTNLTKGELHIHQQGSLWKACRASTSMPAYFPPVFQDGDLLVDGGVIDNIPINIMRNMCEGFVFASNVSTHSAIEQSAPDFEEKSGWHLLFNRLNPFSNNVQVPTIPHVLFRTLEVGMGQHKDHGQMANLCFYPPVQNFSWFDAKPIDEIVEVGYQHGCALLKQWDKEGKLPQI